MIGFNTGTVRQVSDAVMAHVYSMLKTPYKAGAVLKSDTHFTDSPTVIYADGKFCMYSISISKDTSVSGYETHTYTSDNLTEWNYHGTVLRRKNDSSWDSKQCAGYAAFCEPRFGLSPVQECIDGKYYIAYLAGASDGYEPDPLYMGLCHHPHPLSDDVTRLPEPILRPDDADIRPYEDKTLYKSCMFRDYIGKTGHDFVNVYNAKGHDDRERIFLAVSDDAQKWIRYGDRAVIDIPPEIIAGDPHIIMYDDLYIVIFFRYGRGRGAYNTFACSYDLINWRIHDGVPLIYPEYEFENVHAHKPWLFVHEGIVYHFYCACNKNRERFIALATSERIK